MRQVVPKKQKVAECVLCHETKPIFCVGQCSSCYQRERSAASTGVCPICHKTRRLRGGGGICSPCREVVKGVNYAESQSIRRETPAELKKAHERQEDFLQILLPMVRRVAAKAFRFWNAAAREEAMVEATASLGKDMSECWATDMNRSNASALSPKSSQSHQKLSAVDRHDVRYRPVKPPHSYQRRPTCLYGVAGGMPVPN